MIYLIYPMIFVTGVTGLIYQMAWQKYLSVYLGSHALSTSLTLGCFFLFLSLGYLVLGKKGHKLGTNRILAYGYIEGLIGLFAIFSPYLFFSIFNAWPTFPSNSWQHLLSSFGFAFIMIGFPTFLMGATIPLLTQGLSQQYQESHKIHAWVYGVNTLGAFIGSVIAGFYLIETYGLAQTLNITGIVNCSLFLVIWVASKISSQSFSGVAPTPAGRYRGTSKILIFAAFLSGFISFGIESLSIRMSGLALGSSNYTYCIIVSAFILSIAIGSMMAARVSEKRGLQILIASQLAIFISLACLYFAIPNWPDWLMRVRQTIASSEVNFEVYWFVSMAVLTLILIIPVSLMGMTLPLLFQRMKSQNQFLNQTAGTMYAVNALGATLGAIIGGYVLFLWWRADQVFTLLILLSGLSFIVLLQLHQNKMFKRMATICMLLISSVVIVFPEWSVYSFVPPRFNDQVPAAKASVVHQNWASYNNYDQEEKLLFADYGVNTFTVVTEGTEGDRTIYVNAKPDASTAGDHFTRMLTGLVPLTLSQKREKVFIIGLGAGLSTGLASTFKGVQKVRVSEIASGVIKALPFFNKWNFDLEKNRDKVTITNDDAYKVLQTENETYDLIFSEPSNTWVTGVEKIYTKEFLQIAASKLSDTGIYSQWFPLFHMTDESFLSILKNFKSAFPYVTLWNAQGAASLIVASKSPFMVDMEAIKQKFNDNKNIYETAKFKSGEDILYHQMLSESAVNDLVRFSTLEHSLFHPSLAFQSARAYFIKDEVNLDVLATKHFIERDDLLLEKPLLWQQVDHLLSREFFERGVKYFTKHWPIAYMAGRLTLAQARRFDDWKSKKTANKIHQYLYLQDPSIVKIPEPTGEKKDNLVSELFMRYTQLKKMREVAHLDQVLKATPEECTNVACTKVKLGVLALRKSLDTKRVEKLRAEIKDETTQSKVDQLFNQWQLDKKVL